MDTLDNLKSLTDQIEEKKTLLNKKALHRSQLEGNLESCFKNALDSLRRQINDALKEKRLSESELVLPPYKIKDLILADEEKEKLESEISDISETISSLMGKRHKILRNYHDVLEDLGTKFWKSAFEYHSKYQFESDRLKITFREEKFSIPYRRFTEQKEKIIEEIKPYVEKRNVQDKLDSFYEEKKAIELKIKDFEEKISKMES